MRTATKFRGLLKTNFVKNVHRTFRFDDKSIHVYHNDYKNMNFDHYTCNLFFNRILSFEQT